MDIQTEKLKLIEWLSTLTDPSLIEQLKLLKENFSGRTDWWEALSEDVKKSIDEGLNDIETGDTIPHSVVSKKYGKSA